MTPRRVLFSVWIVAAGPAFAPPSAAGAEDPGGLPAFEEARAGYSRAAGDLKNECAEKLKALREKYRQSAERGKAAASRKGDLQLALAWEKLEKELRSEGKSESGQDPVAAPPREVGKARSDYGREASDLDLELRRKLRDLREKYRKTAEERTATETKRGDLKLASAWEEFRKELDPGLVNLARSAKVKVSAALPEHPPENLTDGTINLEANAYRYWFAARQPGRHWAIFDLGQARFIRKVRILAPFSSKWHPNGHEPLDYEVLFRLGGAVRERVEVRDGRHRKRQLIEKGAQWIEIEPKAGVVASEVEFVCTRTSVKNLSPVLFELEILGEE